MFKQSVTSTVFNFVPNKVFPNEVFRSAENIGINTRNNFLKLNYSFGKTSTGQNGLSLEFWDRIPEILKKTKNLNTF